ncbi:MAG TPA: hypothetical protein PLP28_01500 [Flavobacteriales bacterium]|nr:hypothetical protein [Flavobacteriales bacterium]
MSLTRYLTRCWTRYRSGQPAAGSRQRKAAVIRRVHCLLPAACCLLPLLMSPSAQAQQTMIMWAYGPFGTPGDAAYIVENDRIYQACGAYGSRGPCIYVIEQDRVYHSDAFGRPGICAFTLDGNNLVRAQGSSCMRGSCVLLLEGNKVFRGEGPFCTKQEGAFFIEPGGGPSPTLVHMAEGPFATKSDALLQVKGPIDTIALLTVLAGF